MITTAERRRRRPVLAIAIAVSLLLHVVGFVLYDGYARAWLAAVHRAAERKPDEMTAISDQITLEKRTVPRATRRLPPPSRPQPRVRPHALPPALPQPPLPRIVRATPLPVPVRSAQPRASAAPRREIARVAPNAPAQPIVRATAPPVERRAVAQAPRAAAPREAPAANRLTPEEIAQLTQRMKATIARVDADQTNVRPPRQRASTMKKYDMVMSGTPADLTRAQGYVTPLQMRRDRARGLDIYYVEVRIVWPDGFSEIVNLPWQVELPANNDPLLRPGSFPYTEIGPPPGYVLPHPFQLSRTLCLYYRDECQAVIDAEQRNGGAPAAN